jgi:hypothetical protein
MVIVNSRTRLTTFRKIADTGPLGPLLIQLMMAVNDLGIADNGFRQWIEAPPPEHRDRIQGAKSYFVRLMVAHTFEALKVIYKINATPEFKKLVDQCDRQTQEAFARLVSIMGTKEYKTMKRVRNAITFHYETEAIEQAIERQNDKFSDHPMSISIGNKTLYWYFEPADHVADGIIVRDAVGLKSYPVVSAEVDAVAVQLQKIGEDLSNFSGYFIPRQVLR